MALRYGQGKVAAVFTDSLWKWQLSPNARASQPYRRFWDQFIDWLVPEEEALEGKVLDLFVDREQLFLGETLEISARGSKADGLDETLPVTCRVTGPDGRVVPFSMASQFVPTASGKSVPGRALNFKAEEPGLHMAQATTEIREIRRHCASPASGRIHVR